MSEVVVKVSGLGKRYRRGARDRHWTYRTLRESLVDLFRARDGAAADAGTFWALRDVSFEVAAGQVVGIVGANGAGKSTLLKILSRITAPTEGQAEIAGRVGSLLEVGTGFHPELSGRENVFLNGAILGMRRAEIARKFDEIVAFAEVESFLDTPVKHYSSGMYMRLAFAVAAHLEPDTLIVDEVLAVGDVAFQKKCLGKMGDVARQGRTVLFVSHNMGAVRSLCSRALVLGGGAVRFDGACDAAIAYYLAEASARLGGAGAGGDGEGQVTFGPDGLDFESLRLHAIRLYNAAGQVQAVYDAGEPVRVEIEYEVKARLRGARTNLIVSTPEGELAFMSTDHLVRDLEQLPGRYRTSCTIPGQVLNRRLYTIGVSFEIPGVRVLVPRQERLTVLISGVGNHGSHFPERWPGVVAPRLEWTTERW
jgi:lipopolysaccharide transport system ATP-binding protein